MKDMMINLLCGIQKYRYRVRFNDSLDSHVNETEIGSSSPVTEREAEEILKEQLNANNLFPKWVQVIEFSQIQGEL
ncbi:hypothetical protein [Laspinema palackyanum]|uniref:hypothetical protein n=1 Tax=Laspinema palackyanum TaxID=3231601 RepID=UPI00345D19A2|nr:hypothetical protein [Laspinema sp. D2c]